MKKILYACICNNGGMLRVAEWCQRFSLLNDEIVFLLFTKKIFPESDNLKCIEWEEDFSIFSQEKISFYEKEIENKLDLSQIRCMIGDYSTLSYFEKFEIPFFYDVHTLAKSLNKRIHSERKMMSMDNDIFAEPMNSLIDIISFDFLRFENKWIKKAQGFIINSVTTGRDLCSDYRDEHSGKPVYYIPLSGVVPPSQLPKYSDRTFKYHCFTFSRLHPQKGFHFLLRKSWSKSPLFIRGIQERHLKASGNEILKKNSITLLGWSSSIDVLKEDILSSRFILFPAVYEPFGLALQEALSYGAICICHKNHSGHEEQVKDKENGYLIDMTHEDWMMELETIMQTSLEELDRISGNAIKSARIGDLERNLKFQEVIQKEIFFLSEN